MKNYSKPTLVCYEHPDIAHMSATNSNASCQADCAAESCDFVAICSVAPCASCDTNDECGLGVFPNDCPPVGC